MTITLLPMVGSFSNVFRPASIKSTPVNTKNKFRYLGVVVDAEDTVIFTSEKSYKTPQKAMARTAKALLKLEKKGVLKGFKDQV